MIYNKHLLEFLERVSCNNPLALKMTIHSSPPTCAFHLHQSDGERVTFANHGTMHQVDWNGKSLPCPARTRFDSCNVWLWHPAFALLDFSISELALPRVSHGKELFSGRHKKWASQFERENLEKVSEQTEVGNLQEQDGLNWLQMVQFEWPRHWKPLVLFNFEVGWISHFPLLALWGNKNWPPSMKLKKLKILWNKMGLMGC